MIREISGTVSEFPGSRFFGSRPDQPSFVNLNGPLHIDTGNFAGARVTTKEHSLSISRGNCRRMRIRQLEADPFVLLDPASPPEGVTITGGAFQIATPLRRMGSHPQVGQIYKALGKLSPEAATAFKTLAAIIRTGAGDMQPEAIVAAFDAAPEAQGMVIGGAPFLRKLKNALGVSGEGLRDVIRGVTADQLDLKPTEVVEEWD